MTSQLKVTYVSYIPIRLAGTEPSRFSISAQQLIEKRLGSIPAKRIGM